MEEVLPFLLTFADCAGQPHAGAAAAAFIRRVTGVDVVLEHDDVTHLWTGPLPTGWIYVNCNTSRWRSAGWWSGEFFQVSTESHFVPASGSGAEYAVCHREALPVDWAAPNNLWASIHAYALIPHTRVDLVPLLLAAEYVERGYRALALPGETEVEYEKRVGLVCSTPSSDGEAYSAFADEILAQRMGAALLD